jgi:hypothetical protein
VLTPAFLMALDGVGWRYVSGKGRRGSWFERKPADAQRMGANEALAAKVAWVAEGHCGLNAGKPLEDYLLAFPRHFA